jgi:hypothetical protein
MNLQNYLCRDLPPAYALLSSEDRSCQDSLAQIFCPAQSSSLYREPEFATTNPSSELDHRQQSPSSPQNTSPTSRYHYNPRLGPIGNIINLAAVATSRAASHSSNSVLRTTLDFASEFLTSHTQRATGNRVFVLSSSGMQQMYVQQQEAPYDQHLYI